MAEFESIFQPITAKHFTVEYISKENKPYKRVSPYCTNYKHQTHAYRKTGIFLFFLILIVPSLYLIPCGVTYADIYVPYGTSVDDFQVLSYNQNLSNYHTITLSKDPTISDYISWEIGSIEVYFNSYNTNRNYNNTAFMNHIIYQSYFNHTNSLNTLKIQLIPDSNQPNTLIYNGVYTWFAVPVDYFLSYIKIKIQSSSNNVSEYFAINYYHFFTGEPRIDTKLGIISRITITDFSFNADMFIPWLHWSQTRLSGDIPLSYPYTLNTTIKRYNLITDYFGVDTI